jgi:glycosyltransferase involved in cell wall biosynthesis
MLSSLRPFTGRRPTAPRRGPGRRIAFLVWRDTGNPEGGGSELYVERVAQHLAATGWDVTVFTAAYPGAPRDEERDGLHFRRRGGRLTVYLHGLLFLLGRRGRRADVVVDVQNGLPFFAPLVRRRGIVCLVHHVHREQWHMIYPGRVGDLGWFVESRLAPRLYRRHPYVTVSDASRRELIGLGVDAERITVVPNGLDAPAPPTVAERSSAPNLCVLGRLVPHKQVEHALECVAALRPTRPELRLDVVGDGWWRAALSERVEALGLPSAVTFHGHASDRERDAQLDRAWVLLAPSVKEGWGIAIMEAAAHGVPAIAYRSAGGVGESIVDGETGWLVDDLAELTKRVEELLADAELRAWMSANARRHAAGYEWSSSGRRFADVVERAAGGRAS